MVSFTPRPLLYMGKVPNTHWIGGLVGPKAGLDVVAKREKNPFITSSRN
jgi:hypothetical protein